MTLSPNEAYVVTLVFEKPRPVFEVDEVIVFVGHWKFPILYGAFPAPIFGSSFAGISPPLTLISSCAVSGLHFSGPVGSPLLL